MTVVAIPHHSTTVGEADFSMVHSFGLFPGLTFRVLQLPLDDLDYTFGHG